MHFRKGGDAVSKQYLCNTYAQPQRNKPHMVPGSICAHFLISAGFLQVSFPRSPMWVFLAQVSVSCQGLSNQGLGQQKFLQKFLSCWIFFQESGYSLFDLSQLPGRSLIRSCKVPAPTGGSRKPQGYQLLQKLHCHEGPFPCLSFCLHQ